MTHFINIQKFKIYNSYGGDIDGFCRNNRQGEKAVYGDSLSTTWTLIATKLQDIEMISKRLTSYDYAKNTLTELHETTDNETFKLLTSKIPFYADFHKIRQIIETIKSWTTRATNTVWAGYDDSEAFLFDLNSDIEKITFCDFTTLKN